MTKKERNYKAQIKYRELHRAEIAERARIKRNDPIQRDIMNARSKAWIEKNRDKYLLSKKKSVLKHKYGMSLEEYDTLLIKQESKCAICGDKEKLLAIDHCHKTGKIRGLLCHLCNRAIGMMKDDTLILERAITYLKKYV